MVKCVPHLKIEERSGDKRTMADVLSRRRNQLDRAAESWRPPLFRPVKTLRRSLVRHGQALP